jgi:subtilisin family serine protease
VRYGSTDSLLSELLEHTADYTEVSANYVLRLPQVPAPANRADSTDVPIGSSLLDFLGAEAADNWGRGVTIAVLDSGVAPDPTFLTGQLRFLDVGLGTTPGTGTEDGHGTAVAALAAGNAEGAQGIAGAAGILSIRITDDSGLSDIFTLSQGILAAMDAGAQVINISLGGYDTNSVLSSAIARATNAGIAIVASAGNDQLSGLTWPAADPRVVSVGAVDGTGQQVTFSNSGPQLTLTAPGYGVPTAWADGQRVQMDGTSASAPLVAGTIAAVLSQNPTLTGTEAAAIVQQHASDAGEPGADPNYGSGILNVGWTMNRASTAYADTAVASTLYDPATGIASIVVQNRGNQTVHGLQLRVSVGPTPNTLAVPALAPGATASVPVAIDPATLQAAGQLNLGIQLVNPAGLADQFPQNNRAAGTISAPK